MKKLFFPLVFALSVFLFIYSCSTEEDATPPPVPTPIVKYTITLAAGEGGSVSTSGGQYESGQTLNVTATPQAEYVFKSWSDGNTNATRTITVSSNTNLTATFEKKKYPLTINIQGEGTVTEEIISTGKTTEYDSGTTVKLTAKPSEEWLFVGWSGDVESTENPIELNITQSKTVSATFEKKQTQSIIAHDFIWKAMNLWYYWQASVDDLSDFRFSNELDYYNYLKSQGTPDQFFYSKLISFEDRFSYLFNDYKVITQSIQGIAKSNGLVFGLGKFSNTNNVYGFVKYIIPGSNASKANISRGDVFIGVNGVSLNVENYRSLLFAENETYTLNLGNFENNTIYNSSRSVILSKEEISENPVFLTKIFEIDKIKIGYLVYNGFISAYDKELNEAFGYLKSAGVNELILDLRYNSGGSVNSSRLLASMIYGTDSSKLFLKQRWNSKIQSQFRKAQLEDYFTDNLNGNPINSLELSRVYVITTNDTASASELIINGLDPYLKVIQIGTKTSGKNEFSITLVDAPTKSFIYNPTNESSINKNHTWGLQPVVGRNENSIGFSDYTEGFSPDFEMFETLGNFGKLGDHKEPLLEKVLSIIANGDFSMKTNTLLNLIPVNQIDNSKNYFLKDNTLILDKNIEFE